MVCECGIEYERRTTKSLDEFLYFVFDDITSQLAQNFELNNRIESEDSRRQWFSKKLELLSTLSQKWEELEREEQKETLRFYPFSDEE